MVTVITAILWTSHPLTLAPNKLHMNNGVRNILFLSSPTIFYLINIFYVVKPLDPMGWKFSGEEQWIAVELQGEYWVHLVVFMGRSDNVILPYSYGVTVTGGIGLKGPLCGTFNGAQGRLGFIGSVGCRCPIQARAVTLEPMVKGEIIARVAIFGIPV